MGVLDLVLSKKQQQLFRDNRRRWSFGRARAIGPSEVVVGQRCKVVGRAEPALELVPTPYRGEPVILYSASFEGGRYVESENGGAQVQLWARAFEDHVFQPFFVVDDAGARIRVDAGYTLAPIMEYEDATSAPVLAIAALPAVLERYLRARGVRTTGFMGITGDARFLEAPLRARARVTVSGVVDEVTELAEGGYRSSTERVLRMVGTNEEPLILSFR